MTRWKKIVQAVAEAAIATCISARNSKWVVTGDSTLTKLASAGTIVDKSGKTVTVKGTDGTDLCTGNQ